jgi:hypothetical protein
MVKITSEQRRYLRERINIMFQDALNTLNDRAIYRRTEIVRETIERSGIEKAKKQVEAVWKEIDLFNERILKEGKVYLDRLIELNDQFRSVAGFDLVYNYSTEYKGLLNRGVFCTMSYCQGTPLSRLIDEAMSHTPEGAQIKALSSLRLEIEDRLMLDYEGKTGPEILTEVAASIASIVDQAKALPPASTKKDGKEPKK